MNDQNDAAKVRVFPPAVPLIVIFLGLALHWAWPISSSFQAYTPGRYWLGAVIVLGAILGLGFWSVLLVRRNGQSENPWKPTHFIEERGPFSLTRNPMYLQMVLVCIGVGVGLANVWVLILTPIGIWALQRLAILPEEAYLEAKFGEAYLSYKSRVRRWI